MRAALYYIAYWLITVAFALFCLLLAALPGKRALGWGLWLYGSAQLAALRYIAGVRIEVHGRENIPAEPVVFGAKHQSWGDGFVMLANVENLGFVAGDHLYKFPLLKPILKKAGAIVLSNQGGEQAQQVLNGGIARMKDERRHVLIYPEGHLSAPGEKHRYRSGVFHLCEKLDRVCVPVATNLGLAWDRTSIAKTPGTVTVEFLAPIECGLTKEAFMSRLEESVETRTNQLVAKGI
ncbi:1-acyl-sn-glycerol-3-phosphate acyltransferase [Marinicauda algicola]|uniref:1-acyl-sn-glycerol-3-phosphate acyltransferase n=1 Tax=Marinicauda algicola TaxID=2029849 RepID=A0A4V3RYB8_9PROT|nr:lysophospholipid acyltransferase family protein [Marinicauda algicola]TGY89849.1 1-acyl-sn-glycerol-3-phosphate acyltransferase [Marinicauda algicola]